MATLSDRAKLDLKKVMDEYMVLKKKMEFVQGKKKEAEQKQKAPIQGNGEIVIAGTVYPPVGVEMYSLRKEVLSSQRKQRYYVKDGELKEQDYSANVKGS